MCVSFVLFRGRFYAIGLGYNEDFVASTDICEQERA